MRLKKTIWLFLLATIIHNYPAIASAIQFQDSVLSKLEAYRVQALDAQKEMRRDKLDTIADHILALANQGNEEFKHLGLFFKSDGQSRTNPRLAISYGEQALSYFERRDDQYLISRINNVLANCYSNTGLHRKAVKYYENALDASRQTDESKKTSEMRFRAGISYNAGFALVRQGDLESAADFLLDAQEIALELKDTLIICSVLHQIGNIHAYRKDFNGALNYYREGLKLAQLGSQVSANYLMSGIAGAYQEMGILDSALYYNLQIVSLFRKQHNNSSLCNGLYNLAETYLAMGELEKSITTSEELMQLATQTGIDQFQLNAAIILGKAYMEKDNYNHALSYVEMAMSNIDENTEFDILCAIYQIASIIQESRGNYKTALQYNRLFKQYSDSLLNQQTLTNLNQLKIEYETYQKEQRIEQLESDQKLDVLAFRQKLLLGGGLILATVLIAAIVLLILNRKRLLAEKQRDSVEQRLLRSQMNPHFIFNAISSIQNYLFDKSDLKIALDYLSKFADLMRQILENSREEYITLSAEIKSLKNYLELQQLRYSNSFGYELIVDPEIDQDNLLVPPLIAQPFVENAIEHGMIYRIKNGKVIIKIESQGDELTLTIQDNGVGTKKMKVVADNISGKKSLATIITQERLKNISKASRRKFDLVIDALQSGGTVVTIQLPKVFAA